MFKILYCSILGVKWFIYFNKSVEINFLSVSLYILFDKNIIDIYLVIR